jgi:hypothetical protein
VRPLVRLQRRDFGVERGSSNHQMIVDLTRLENAGTLPKVSERSRCTREKEGISTWQVVSGSSRGKAVTGTLLEDLGSLKEFDEKTWFKFRDMTQRGVPAADADRWGSHKAANRMPPQKHLSSIVA